MVQGSTFFVQSATNLQSPWGRYNPSLLFRILTPHFLWQVKVIVPKISVIMDYTFLWSASYRVFSETKCWKSCVVFSCSSKANSASAAGWGPQHESRVKSYFSCWCSEKYGSGRQTFPCNGTSPPKPVF